MSLPRLAAATIVLVASTAAGSALASTPNTIYVVPKRVELLPNEAAATEVVIHGSFTLYQGNDAGPVYGPVSCSYMYFRCKTGEEAACRMQWQELKSAIATPTCEGMGQQSTVTTATLRALGTPLGTPDLYDIGMGLQVASFLGGKCAELKANVCNVGAATDGGVDAPATGATCVDKTTARAADGTVTSCVPYLCSDGVCGTSCTTDASCGAAFVCRAGKCSPASGSRCTDDNHGMVASDGKIVSCSPYLCRDNACLRTCASDKDCNAGLPCDTGTRACGKFPPPAEDSGCSYGARAAGFTGGSLAIAIAALARLVRRRR